MLQHSLHAQSTHGQKLTLPDAPSDNWRCASFGSICCDNPFRVIASSPLHLLHAMFKEHRECIVVQLQVPRTLAHEPSLVRCSEQL